MDDSACPWRQLTYWELDDFFRQIRATVLELEDAYSQGQLASSLQQPELVRHVGREIVASYEQLLGSRARRIGHLRLDAVHSMLSLMREEIFEISHHADARVCEPPFDLSRCVAVHSTVPRIAARIGESREVLLRLDQLLAVRFWGIGFVFDDVAIATNIAHLVAHACTNEFAKSLRGLDRVLARFRPKGSNGDLRIVPPPQERRFEHLMLDILNEEGKCARMAPVDEDFLEKTDLRIDYPDLRRKRGARIQVTQIDEPALHHEKTSRIRHQQEYVILSPLTVARFITEEGQEVLAAGVLEAFWQGFPKRPSTVRDLAASIKQMLLMAMNEPPRDPLGPMPQVAMPLREIIRAFVRRESLASTKIMRSRERSIKGYSQVTASVNPVQHAPVHMQIGSVIEGAVKKIVKYGAFIDLGGVDGLLHSSAIGPECSLVIGQRVRVSIARIEGKRIALTLSSN